jgi:cyclic pyranopterin phosphate synthase
MISGLQPSEPGRSLTGAARDKLGRPMANLRLSVTDRCNLRCGYCMPEETYAWLPRKDLLSFEEITRLTDVFCNQGVRKVRLTGGEPLLRSNLDQLVSMLAARPLVEDLAMTTNGVRLAEHAEGLRKAGLHRVTISLDTLIHDRYQSLTRRNELERVLSGIKHAQATGFANIKLNVVLMRGFNDDELEALLRFGHERDIEVRFIEYMDVGGATQWDPNLVVSRAEILERLERAFGSLHSTHEQRTSAPAESFSVGQGMRFGVVASTTTPFCGSCDRSRVTADGTWFRCLYGRLGTDLRTRLRDGSTDAELKRLIGGSWRARRDQGAQERGLEGERSALAGATELRADPHLEMHTRGG